MEFRKRKPTQESREEGIPNHSQVSGLAWSKRKEDGGREVSRRKTTVDRCLTAVRVLGKFSHI